MLSLMENGLCGQLAAGTTASTIFICSSLSNFGKKNEFSRPIIKIYDDMA